MGNRALSLHVSFNEKMVLKRPFVSGTGKDLPLYINCSISCETELPADMTVLIGRCSQKDHSPVRQDSS